MTTNTSRAKFQHAGLKLSFALMLGLLVVPGYVVAPMLFTELESAQAGVIAGQIFKTSNVAILILALASAVFCYRMKVAKATWYVLMAVVVVVAANTFGVASMMMMIKAEVGDIASLTHDDPMRWAFSFWHGMGSILHLIASVLMVFLVMKEVTVDPQEKATI